MTIMSKDPRLLAEEVCRKVARGGDRRYYRVGRTGRWYGGIATADCCGCNLRCVFCWSNHPRDHPETGRFWSPEEVAETLIRKAREKEYRQVRISGNEPTIACEHLLAVIDIVDSANLHFILETNGILIDQEFARRLRVFKNLHVRVSIKGTNEREFERLTETSGVGFHQQIEALNHLLKEGISCHPAVMVSFSKGDRLFELKRRLARIDPYLTRVLEEESAILYPHVRRRLAKRGFEVRSQL